MPSARASSSAAASACGGDAVAEVDVRQAGRREGRVVHRGREASDRRDRRGRRTVVPARGVPSPSAVARRASDASRHGGCGRSAGTCGRLARRLSAERGLRRREPRDRHAERRAGHVVEPDARGRSATERGSPPCSPQMPSLSSGSRLPALARRRSASARRRPPWSSDANGSCGKIPLSTYVGQEARRRRRATAPKRRLRQVVGAEREEVGRRARSRRR